VTRPRIVGCIAGEEGAVEARYKPGDRVQVRVDSPPRHIRTPAYIQEKTGWVVAVHGAFRNPESLAHGGDGLPERFLYLVRFPQTHVWAQYPASPNDQLFIDLYEHWLSPA
jgi:poly(3-hydroxybutyrate) depolymerase